MSAAALTLTSVTLGLIGSSPAWAAAAPTITSPSAATARAGSPFSFSVTTRSASVPTISVTHLPPGLAFVDNHNGTATISGKPARADGGPYKATVAATQVGASAAVQALTITVDNSPVFASPTTCSAHVGIAFSCTLETPHAFPAASITTTSLLPGGVTLTPHGKDAATLGGTPALGSAGVRTITCHATNSVGAASHTVVLTVVGAPTVLGPTSITLVQDSAMTPTTFTATGYPVPRIVASGLPSGLTFTDHGNSSATLAGTPTAALGSYRVSITSTSSAGSATVHLAVAVVVGGVPGAPTVDAVSITSIGIGNADVAVRFSPPDSGGGLPITSYTVTAVDSTDVYNGGQTVSGVSSPLTLTGLVNGDSYTFTVTATNVLGTGPASAPSVPVIPATESWPPTDVSATVPPTAHTAVVAFNPPILDGGSVITEYTVTATDITNPLNGDQTASGTASPITVSGLVDGDSYSFSVTATNGVGVSVASTPSNVVTPQVPPVPTITSVTSPTGTSAGGITVTITGSGLSGASSVTFGSESATFTFVDDTTITATTPAHALGTVDVEVTTPGGTSVHGVADQYTYTPPPDLSIAVTAKPSDVYVGASFTETYTVTNTGGSPAANPVVADLDGGAYASSVSVASMTCVDTVTGHSGRDGGITHTGYQCSMPAGQVLAAGASITIVATFLLGTTLTVTQHLSVTTSSTQQNVVSHSVTDVITPVTPAAPATPTGVSVSQSAGSLLVSFAPGVSTSPGAPITSSVTATSTGGGSATLTGSVVTGAPGTATVTLAGVLGSTTYDVVVTSGDAGGTASADAVAFTTGPPSIVPGAPVVTAASWGSLTNIVATWTAAAQGDSVTSDYQVLLTPRDPSYASVSYDAGTSLIASVDLPTEAISWTVQVRAENAAGWGPWSPAMTVPSFDN